MQLSKIKDLAEAARNNTVDKNSPPFSFESKRDELLKQIKKISQAKAKGKKKGKVISKRVLLVSGVIVFIAISIIGGVLLYLNFYVKKRKKNSNNATSSNDEDKEATDDEEFESEE